MTTASSQTPVAVINEASNGIGRAVAQRLALCARRQDRLDVLALELKKAFV